METLKSFFKKIIKYYDIIKPIQAYKFQRQYRKNKSTTQNVLWDNPYIKKKKKTKALGQWIKS